MILDIYSRYAVGWMLARAERAELSKRLIADTIAKQGVTKDQLTIHSDRGSPMIAKASGPPLGRPRGDQVAQPAPREQ